MPTKTTPKNRIAQNGAPTALYAPDRLTIEVVGVTPLLCANPASMQPEADASGRSKSKQTPTKEEVARTAAYIDADGHCCFPNSAILSCILSAAELMKLRVGSGKYAPGAAKIIGEGLSFDYEVRLTKLINPKTREPLTEKDYEIDMQRGVNQNTGGGIVVIRPRFDHWAAHFRLLVDTGNADLMGLIDKYFPDILRFAGMTVGMGAFRGMIRKRTKAKVIYVPGGPYGKFSGRIVD